MKLYMFLKWLFDFGTMEGYNKRYIAYIVFGCVGTFFTPFAGVAACVLMLLDLLIDMLRDKYKEFEKEVLDVTPKTKSPSKMMQE